MPWRRYNPNRRMLTEGRAAPMPQLLVTISDETYQQLWRRAVKCGKPVQAVIRESLEATLAADPDTAEPTQPVRSAREVLEAAGHLRPLGPTLERMIVPGVTLEEVVDELSRGGGPSLSEIIDEQRGPKG
jgi:hypothetical protein